MDPTNVKECGYRAHNRMVQYLFTLTSVDASDTGLEEELAGLPKQGMIKGINCSCASTDFDLSIRNKTGVSADTNNEIFQTEGENLHYNETEATLVVPYVNRDTTQKGSLYAIVKNDDAVNATGDITLELTVEILESI